jgi:hypothetical protein
MVITTSRIDAFDLRKTLKARDVSALRLQVESRVHHVGLPSNLHRHARVAELRPREAVERRDSFAISLNKPSMVRKPFLPVTL